MKKKAFISLTILCVVIGFGFFQFQKHNSNRQLNRSHKTLELRTIVSDLSAIGFVRAMQDSDLVPNVKGQIQKVLVKEGDWVEKNQPVMIVQISKADQFTLSSLRSNLKMAKLQRLEIESQLKPRLTNPHLFTHEEVEKLKREKAILIERVALAENELESHYEKMKIRHAASLKSDHFFIDAPLSGYVSNILKDVGDAVCDAQPCEALFHIIDARSVKVSFKVPESDLVKLSIGQKILLMPEKMDGVIEKISTQAVNEQGVSLFPIVALVENPESQIKTNTHHLIKIPLETKQEVLAAPLETIYMVDQRFYLEKIVDQRTTKVIPVTMGISDAQWGEIISDEMNVGDRVLIVDYSKFDETNRHHDR